MRSRKCLKVGHAPYQVHGRGGVSEQLCCARGRPFSRHYLLDALVHTGIQCMMSSLSECAVRSLLSHPAPQSVRLAST
eukprot:5487604-Karenia_brevis.AAC.1